MRCECCNALLNDIDATAKFGDGRFVNMCKKCREFLPKDVVVHVRADLDPTAPDEDLMGEFFFDEEYYDDDES